MKRTLFVLILAVLLCLSACGAPAQGVIEYLCAEGLSDKAMFGTDAPLQDPRPMLGWVASANISREDKEKILGGNMQKVLDKVHF